MLTGYARQRFGEYIEDRGALGVAEDLAKSLITSVPRGIQATAQTLGGGFGERPIERIGEMTGALLPLRAGAGLASVIARSTGRPALARTLGKAVSHPISRGAAWTGETADIIGAEEDVYSEGLLEILGEGVAEAGGAIGRGAKERIQRPEVPDPDQAPETAPPDPIQQKQQQRADDNDAAAAETAQRTRGPSIQATLDQQALELTALTQSLISRSISTHRRRHPEYVR